MPDLYSDSMLLSEARARIARLLPTLERPDQQAIDVLAGRLDRLEAIVATGRKMRAAQKDYFRSKAGLPECKALESKFDGMAKE